MNIRTGKYEDVSPIFCHTRSIFAFIVNQVDLFMIISKIPRSIKPVQ